MPKLMYTIFSAGDDKYITVFVPGQDPKSAPGDHPNFDAIVTGAVADDPDVLDLFDIAETAGKKFARLSERVTAGNGNVYVDGDAVDDSLAQQIVRFLDEDVDDWQPLVAFMEKVYTNPNEHSRTQLYDWLRVHEGITITQDGNLVAYKGVARDAEGDLWSIHRGEAVVNGEAVTGQIPNQIGSTVEMPRSEVMHDPRAACSVGLHVGTFSYAKDYARGAMLEVEVNPRDVVSVPRDASGQKIRVCRYTVIGEIEAAYSTVVRPEAETLEEPVEFKVGDRVIDPDGDHCEVVVIEEDETGVWYIVGNYDNLPHGIEMGWSEDELTRESDSGAPEVGDTVEDEDGDEGTVTRSDNGTVDVSYEDDGHTWTWDSTDVTVTRRHGKGGPTSQAAKGRGKNPAQDAKGQFSQGRPGSTRNASTGRFSR